MRKLVLLVLVLGLLFGMAGCGEPKVRTDISESTAAALKAAIETLDAFLSYDIDAEAAESKLERISNSMPTNEISDQTASLMVFNAKVELGIYKRGEKYGGPTVDFSEIRETREKLHDFLYKK